MDNHPAISKHIEASEKTAQKRVINDDFFIFLKKLVGLKLKN